MDMQVMQLYDTMISQKTQTMIKKIYHCLFFFQVANNVELDIQSKLASVCGDLLYCDISALETVCSDILLKGDETTGNEVRNTRNKRSSQTNSQERVQKILTAGRLLVKAA